MSYNTYWIGQDGNVWTRQGDSVANQGALINNYDGWGFDAQRLSGGTGNGITWEQIQDPNLPQNDSTYSTGGSTGGTSSTADPATLEAYNTQLSGLRSQLETLNPQEDVAKQGVLNQYQSGYNNLETQYNRGIRDLNYSSEQVQGGKERSLDSLRNRLLQQAQSYANQLGTYGAGDSSASGMINFALSQQGARNRGDVLRNATDQMEQIGFQKSDLETDYTSNKDSLDRWKTQSLFDIVNQFQTQRNQIRNSILDAQARLAAEQDLTSQAVDLLRQLAGNYASQAKELSGRFTGLLAPSRQGMDQSYQVKPISEGTLAGIRMPSPVNPEAVQSSILRRRDEELLSNPLGV